MGLVLCCVVCPVIPRIVMIAGSSVVLWDFCVTVP